MASCNYGYNERSHERVAVPSWPVISLPSHAAVRMWSVWGTCVRSDAGLWEEIQMNPEEGLRESHRLVAQQDTQYKLGACSPGHGYNATGV